MAAGMDLIDGSYAVRAASAGAALLLREGDRGQAGQQGVDGTEMAHATVSQPAPVSPRMSPRHSGQFWRRASQAAAAQQEHSSKEREGHASASQGGTTALDSGPASGDVAPNAAEHKPSFVREVGISGKSSRGTGTAEEWDLDDTTISLHSERFRRDTGPLSRDCKCHTCMRHTRAYIHHLFNVNEMLGAVRGHSNTCCQLKAGLPSLACNLTGLTGRLYVSQVLLEVHNTRNYLDFFADARRAIGTGSFADFQQAFSSRRSLRYSHTA